MRVLVTGANGMLGMDLCTLLEEAGHTVIRTDLAARPGVPVSEWTPLDITNPQAVQDTMTLHQPDAVVHAAAWADVDGCERNPNRAFLVNTQGTWNVAAACGSRNALLVYISTDFVFDGTKPAPYTEFDLPHPLSHYGESKLAGEQLVTRLCPRHFITRTSWLFGAHGTNFPAKILELAKTRHEFPVVCDQFGSPTHTVDLARKLIWLLDSPLYGIYHITNTGKTSWCELASTALELAGIRNVHVIPTPASQWPSPTRRPENSVLRHQALEMQGKDDLPDWKQGLADFLARRTQVSA